MGDMGKVPYSVSKSTRVEFEDTERSFVALDQDFPIATRCTMATTGVVCGAPKINMILRLLGRLLLFA